MKPLPCRLPCSRCSALRFLRVDGLCVACGDAQDVSRQEDWRRAQVAVFEAWLDEQTKAGASS